MLRILETLFSLLGAVVLFGLAALFLANRPAYTNSWLEGFLLGEVILIAVIGLFPLVSGRAGRPVRLQPYPWIAAGALFAFLIFGAGALGVFVIPGAVAYLVVGVLSDIRLDRNILRHLGLLLLAFVTQTALVFVLLLLEA